MQILIRVRKPSSITWLLAAARLIGSNPLPRTALIASAAIAATLLPQEVKAINLYAGISGEIGGAIWNNSQSTSNGSVAFTSSADLYFTNAGGAFTWNGAKTIGNVTVTENTTITYTSGTLTTKLGGSTIDVASGKTLTWTSPTWAAGFNITKTGLGTWVSGSQGSANTGTLTLANGTMTIAGASSLGGASADFIVTGGSLISVSTAARVYASKSFTVNGNFNYGAQSNYLATFSSNVALGSATRTLTSDSSLNNVTFTGIISGSTGAGITFDSTSQGSAFKTNISGVNTFTGPVTISNGEVVFALDSALGASANSITIDGGRLTMTTGDIAPTHNIYLGATAASTTAGSLILGTGINLAGTYAGVMADKSGVAGILVKQGSGTMTLTGVSTYTGQTYINNGTIKIAGGDGRLPSTTILNLGSATANLGTFDLNAFNQTVGGLVSTTGNYAGASTNIVTSATAATLTINTGASTYSYSDNTPANSGIITGAVSIVKSGSGTQTFGGTNTYSGTTTISAGTLKAANNSAFSSGVITINGGTLDLNSKTIPNSVTLTTGTLSGGTIPLSQVTPQAGTISAILSGSGTNFAKSAAGTLTLSGVNTYTGTTTVSGGTLTANTGTLATTSGIIVNGAILNAVNYNTAATLALDTSGTATISGNGLTIAGAATNNNTTASALSFTGTGTITLATLAGGGSTRFGSDAAITGGVSTGTVTVVGLLTAPLSGGTVNAGSLTSTSITGGTNTISGAASITTFNSSSGSTTVGGVATVTTLTTGTLNLNGATSSIATLNGGEITLGTNTALTVSAGTSSTGISGPTGSLVKNTSGTLTLAGTHTYGGTTTVSAGSLIVNGAIASGSAVSVNSTGTLGGSGTVGAVTVNTGGTISPGNSPGTLTTGNVIFALGGNYNWQLLNSGSAAGTGYDFISSTGSLTINATSETPFKINLWSLSNSSTSGNATFNANANLTLTLGTFATGITGFDAAKFSIITIAANGTDGFSNTLNGAFTVAQSGNNLNLVYTTSFVASSDSTYTGGAGNWSTVGNWSGGAGATNGYALIFSGTGGGVTSNDLTLDPIPSLTFSAAAGAYTLNGNALTFGSNGILNSSAATQTIGLNLTQSANSSITATGGALVLNGSLDNAGFTLSLTGASNLTTASLLGSGTITKSGAGTLTLSGTVATTIFNVSQGTLLLGSADRLANTATLTGSGAATIDLGGYTDTIATYNQSGTATLTNGTPDRHQLQSQRRHRQRPAGRWSHHRDHRHDYPGLGRTTQFYRDPRNQQRHPLARR